MAELPLHDLHVRHRGLTQPLAESFAEAAAVCLQRHHAPPVQVTLVDNGVASHADVTWIPPSTRVSGAWANTTDATESGAYACVIASVELLREFEAVRRAETLTGADYYIAPAGSVVEDLEICHRLEISGLDEGGEKEVLRRLNQKVKQARAGASNLPAVAGVIGFQSRLIMLQDVSEQP